MPPARVACRPRVSHARSTRADDDNVVLVKVHTVDDLRLGVLRVRFAIFRFSLAHVDANRCCGVPSIVD
jgi:hypothetical protein